VQDPSSPFIFRHLGPRPSDIQSQLTTLGLTSLDDLADAVVPSTIRSSELLDLPGGQTEEEALESLKELFAQNKVAKSFIGQGYYGTHLPKVILRNLLENPGWYTAYTPYQPEISQGRLEALFNFQTMVTELTAMEVASASLLDEGTAAAEAMAMAHRNARGKKSKFLVAHNCHQQTIDVVKTRAFPQNITVELFDPRSGVPEFDNAFGILLQYPGTDGFVQNANDFISAAHENKALAIVAADLLALTLLTPPGELGADIVVGCTQRFGVPMGFGGPHAAYMAVTEKQQRNIPGRLIGLSIDSKGRDAYRLALQTREQHIRREKATSNVCTAQVLLAVIAAMYASYHGPEGLKEIAVKVNKLANSFSDGINKLGLPCSDSFFDTVAVETGTNTDAIIQSAAEAGYNLRKGSDQQITLSFDETHSLADVNTLLSVITKATGKDTVSVELSSENLPAQLVRQSSFMSQECFHLYRSETEMMRYLRKLMDKDLALDRAMIPLGSCTMKLNAAAEMIPVTWEETGNIHPFAPADQWIGYEAMIRDLEDMLCKVTGFDAVSIQPNAGSQGEFAGLLAIKAFQDAEGQGSRDICLIPSSAHGTNPASAQMAGMKVVVVKCDDEGNVDVEDLQAKAETHTDALSALMITYPSTHGVFEASIRDICQIIHDNGGQVYMDGANLNAQIGMSEPGEFGADVSHMNLHKTFCIPHGGGGPGVGPIGVRSHLAPYLPGHQIHETERKGGTISSAPFGSASILPISWMYMKMMGGDGLKMATELAILNANYMAKRLSSAYPVLYSGPGGWVAHECIIDVRQFKEAGVTVDDIAKRLIDYGFHAPTMSFPVPGTLMIEPTESESKEELDRFCDAMLSIREEIAKVEKGEWPADDNPLHNAPHTAEDLMTDDWSHPYSRSLGAYPSDQPRGTKYWAPVSRVDQVYGDRNLVCSCPPMEAYAEAAE
jgi:glycine dehydrogenase